MVEKQHTKKTLMGWSKEALVEHCSCLEHNNNVLSENIERQYEICKKLSDDMDSINKITTKILRGRYSDMCRL